MTTKWIPIAAVCVILGIYGCRKQNEADEETSSGKVCVPVKIHQLAQKDIESVITASGMTDALRKEKIVSPLAGKIIALNVLEGSHIHTGDVLCVIRTKEAQASVEGARTLMRNASTDRQRDDARRALALADSLQPQITIRASFDGIVASRNVTEGEVVGEQAELLTIIDPTTIVFIADLPIGDISKIQTGLSANIRFPQFPTMSINASVDAINPQAETQSQSVKVRLRFRHLADGQQKLLKANTPGTTDIITDTHRNVLVVDRSVLLHDDEGNAYSLVVMTSDSLAKIIPIRIGIQSDSTVEVMSDLLRAGMNIITEGQYALTDSTKVTIEQ
jgi:multidrug efflux pump subunit AcrA (membrane-fusion protein)